MEHTILLIWNTYSLALYKLQATNPISLDDVMASYFAFSIRKSIWPCCCALSSPSIWSTKTRTVVIISGQKRKTKRTFGLSSHSLKKTKNTWMRSHCFQTIATSTGLNVRIFMTLVSAGMKISTDSDVSTAHWEKKPTFLPRQWKCWRSARVN